MSNLDRRRCVSENILDSADVSFAAISLEDYVRLNPLPGFATIFRTPANDTPSRVARRSTARSQEVYIHSVERVTNAVAEEVSFEESRRRGRGKRQRFLIPLGYSGWFEVLSQDGRCTRPIVSVVELSRLPPTTPCLVRETLNGFRRAEDGALVMRTVRKGQLLRPQETLCSTMRNDARERQLLRCVDQRGEDVFLALEEQGLFSQVACPSSIAGAHDIRSLLEKFRLPITIRLLHGNTFPLVDSKHAGVFKLLGVHSEEVAYVLPVDATNRNDLGCWELIPIPTRQRNLMTRLVTDEWRTTNDELFGFLRKRCKCLIATQADTIRPETIHNRHWLVNNTELGPARMDISEGENDDDDDEVVPHPQPPTPEEELLFREIEDLYAWVRCPQRSPESQRHDTLRSSKRFDTTAAFFHCAKVTRPLFPQKRPAFHGTNWKLQQRQCSVEDACPSKHDIRHQAVGNEPCRKTTTSAAAPVNRNRLVPTMRLIARVKPMPRCIPSSRDCGARKQSQENHTYEEISFASLRPTGSKGTGTLVRAHLATGVPGDAECGQVRATKENQRRLQSSTATLQNTNSSRHLPQTPPTDPRTTKWFVDLAAELNGDGESRFQRDASQRSFRPIVAAKPTPPVLLRPKSHAGTAHTDPLQRNFHGRLPAAPPLPPKRVASVSNLTQFRVPDTDCRRSPSPGGERIVPEPLASPNQHTTQHLSPPGEYSINTIGSRPTATIIGTVSRSLARTLRRIGTKSTGTLELSSSSLDDEDDEKSPRQLWKKSDPHGTAVPLSPSGSPQSPSSSRHNQLSILATKEGVPLSY